MPDALVERHLCLDAREVVSPRDRDRHSVAFFLDPNPDAEIACLPTCAVPAQ